jgi:ankyrin repeat protein
MNRIVIVLLVLVTVLSAACVKSIDQAIVRQDFQQIKSIVERDARVLDNTQGQDQPPLHLAIKTGNLNIIRYLVDNGAEVNGKNWDGDTPLHIAASRGDYEIMSFLVSRGADVKARNKLQSTPLHHASYQTSFQPIQFLVENGAAVNATNHKNETPLNIAVYKGNYPIIEYLIASGADVNIADNIGMSPLHHAIYGGNTRVIELLLANDGDVFARNDAGNTPLDIARIRGFNAAVSILSHGMGKKNITPDAKTRIPTAQTEKISPGPKTAKKKAFFENDPAIKSPFLQNFHALVIGNNDYLELTQLKTAVRDAEVVAKILREFYGFKTRLITNGTRRDIVIALDNLRREMREEDNLLIYYAGHGYYDEAANRGYWLPVEAQRSNTVDWISNADITDKLKAYRARHVLVVADSCYSGTLTRGLNIRIKEPDYIQRIAPKRSRTVLTSGGNEPVYDSGGGEHSVFAKAFIQALQENTGVMDGTTLFTQIRRPVVLNAPQTPQYSDIRFAGHDGGDFIFVRVK